MRGKLLALVLFVTSVPAAADEVPEPPVAPGNPQVTLPLGEYERIRKLGERASVTVVDTLRLGGSFRARDLTVSFTGRSSGKLPSEDVLVADEGVSVYGCTGDGIVARSDAGFALTPLAPKFDVKCRLSVRGTDRLELRLPRAVLWVESQIPDGELVAGGSDEAGRAVSVVRRTASSRETLPAAATGRYRITLRPDETRFWYQIEARNPNRSLQTLDVTLKSGEHVLQVDTAVPYEVDAGRYTFELPPGDTRLVLTGTLGAPTFTPPVEGTLQYALLDSHPLLHATLAGPLKRVSPEEVGIAAEFRGAQAFLLGKNERLEWSVTRLEALRSTSFAVRRESHVLFVGSDGPVVGETAFAIDNLGAADVSTGLRPEPTFASLAGETLLLTTNAAGGLRLPLGRGNQELVLQHRQASWRGLGLAAGAASLPRLPAPSSRAVVEVRYPEELLPLFERFGFETHVHLPGRGVLLLAALVFLLTDQALRLLGLPSGPRVSSALLVAVASLVSRESAAVVLAADVAVIGLALAAPGRRIRWTTSRIAIATALSLSAIAVLLTTASHPVLRKTESLAVDSAIPREVPRDAADLSAKALQVASPNPAADTASTPGYQGLPARFEMPGGARRSRFSREMLPADGPRVVRFLAISKTLAFWLGAGVAAAAAASVLRSRRKIAAGWKALLDEARRASPPPLGTTTAPA